jgi:hypothetical protein
VEHVCHLSEQVLKLLQLARAHPADEFLVEVVKDARAGVGFVPSALGEADQAVLRGTAALPTYFRVSSGPGWALVGDAGHHKDPVIARASPMPSATRTRWPRPLLPAGTATWRWHWTNTGVSAIGAPSRSVTRTWASPG